MLELPPPSFPVESSGYAWPFGSYNYFNYSSSAPWYLPTQWGWGMPYYMTHVWDDREQFTWGHQQQRAFWPAGYQGPCTPTEPCYRAPNLTRPVPVPVSSRGSYDENGNFVPSQGMRQRNGPVCPEGTFACGTIDSGSSSEVLCCPTGNGGGGGGGGGGGRGLMLQAATVAQAQSPRPPQFRPMPRPMARTMPRRPALPRRTAAVVRAAAPPVRQRNFTFGFGPMLPREQNPDDMWNPIGSQRRAMARRTPDDRDMWDVTDARRVVTRQMAVAPRR